MIKLTAADYVQGNEIRLRFSDGSSGVLDFTHFVTAGTSMTEPLRDTKFFRRFFIELGALAWPNGFDLSAASLQKRLKEAGRLARNSEAA